MTAGPRSSRDSSTVCAAAGAASIAVAASIATRTTTKRWGRRRVMGDTVGRFRICAKDLPDSVELRPGLPGHEALDEFGGDAAVIDHRTHHAGDRHVHPVSLRQFEHRLGGLHALGDHLHLPDHLSERPPLAELDADASVAALLAEAGRHQVAHAGESGEGERVAAEGDAEPGE